MAVSRLICPECETVLRPAKPLAAGKKVKCPKCGTTFAARDEEDPPPKKNAAKKKAEPAPKQTGMEYETSTYAVIKEKEDEDKEAKEDRGDDMVAEYLKINKSKDPRGPAQEAVMPPTNWLIITGACGAIAYGIILLGIIILTFMPVKSPDEAGEEGAKKKKLKGLIIGPGVAVVGDGIDPFKAEKEEKAKQAAEGAAHLAILAFFSAVGWILFILFTSFFIIGILYGALIIYGAVKAQSMESRGWGIASSILPMVPINGLAFMLITVVLTGLLLGFLYNDPFVVMCFLIGLLVVEAAWGVSIGIWNIKTLMDPVVVAGFEYVEDEIELMSRNNRVWQAMGFGLVLIALTGCTSQSAKLMHFNDQISLANKKLAMATWDFRETIYPLSQNTPPDPDTVKSAYENLKNALAEIRKEHDKAKEDLPQAATAEGLHTAYGVFLDGQEQLIEREFAAMVAWAESPKLKPFERWAKIQGEIFKVQEKERKDMEKLQGAHNKFTEEVSMKVVLTR